MIKISLTFLLVIICTVFADVAFALDDQVLPTDGSFYDAGAQAAREAATATLVAAMVAQSDTNVTTTVTLYTPRRVGDTLVGGKGAGTNLVCIAKGTTTNDWVQIKP